MQAIMRGEFVPPSKARAGVPAALDPIIAKALAGDPDQRFRSADAFADALDAFSRVHGEASPRDVGDAVSVRGGGSIVLRRARIAEAIARLDGRVSAADARIPVPAASSPYVPSQSGVVDAGRVEDLEDMTQVGLPLIDPSPSLDDAVPSFVSSGDLEVPSASGPNSAPHGNRFAIVQVALLTIVAALALLALRQVVP